jgi:acetylornithine deacetylase/succinyl-diaminopimelate desuccinylase-like protein
MEYSQLDQYLESHLSESIEELSDLVRQPSVSAQKWGLEECAALIGETLNKRGFDVQILPTNGGPPVVVAERKGTVDKTLIFYNHYDVQPAEPLELWESEPFEPVIRDGRLYGRGASDDKGHFATRVHAIDAILDAQGELPCNIKFVLEGEEETGSVHLEDFVKANKDLLSGDACVWECGGVDHRGVPTQELGLRGLCYVELSATTANQDTHSGMGGSVFENAAWRLVWALNTLKGEDERICIQGFYDDVQAPSDFDLELMGKLPDIGEQMKQRYGLKQYVKGLTGGTDLRVAQVFEPTCTICGLESGYQGPGSKTVLPAKASAKVDFRLVPNQKPEKVLKLLREHLDREGFEDIEITYHGGVSPSRTDPEDPFVQLAIKAAVSVYEHPMELVPMMGGSGPSFIFADHLNVPIIMAGAGTPDDQVHAPNESVSIEQYLKASKYILRIIKMFAEE